MQQDLQSDHFTDILFVFSRPKNSILIFIHIGNNSLGSVTAVVEDTSFLARAFSLDVRRGTTGLFRIQILLAYCPVHIFTELTVGMLE